MSIGSISTGKHMVCDLSNIRNMDRLENINSIEFMLDSLCSKHDFHILGKMTHQFEPPGISIVYMLSESHISVHTFPEKGTAAFDIYTCGIADSKLGAQWILQQMNAGYHTLIDIGR